LNRIYTTVVSISWFGTYSHRSGKTCKHRVWRYTHVQLLEIHTNLPWPVIPRKAFEVSSNIFDLDEPICPMLLMLMLRESLYLTQNLI
jgi:hypothetical protein